ncbi:hypothetical protein [uncultured Kluyvera sp.]|jgi:hypothetical protein|uniref:Lipoprotein n=1 Tax=Siphoviridae sp. ctpLW14 TaxID=2826464 RepID=A0A8S5N946_9CAUD|nr:hypothetical protein [uncultured Kluyvera sp.]DAD90972.1 MAG TPA: hypothetical protein [Siphoviridae sp. ctpLW14]
MKGLCGVIFSCMVLVGCANPSIQKQRDILVSRAPSDYAVNGSTTPVRMNDIREQLVSNGWETNDFIKRLTDKCYHLSYYDSGSCALDYYYGELLTRKSEKQSAACDKNEECVRNRNVDSASQSLNATYYLVMARNQYDQSWFDLNIRSLCKSAGIAQRNGISLDRIKYDVEQQPGLSPEVRGQFRDVAAACWVLSKNGIQDGTTTIKNIY